MKGTGLRRVFIPKSLRRRLIGAGMLTALIVAVATTVAPRTPAPATHSFTETFNPELVGSPSGGCQTDPVTVGYTVVWPQPNGPFVVSKADVTGLDAACGGAVLTVSLADSGNEPISGASGSTTVNATSAVVPIGSPPAASVVDNVNITLTGSGTAGTCVSISTSEATQISGTYNGNYEVKSGTVWLNGGTIYGNVTVNAAASFLATGGSIRGNVDSNGGSVTLQGVSVTGNVQATNGGLDLEAGTAIDGNVQVSSGPTPPAPPTGKPTSPHGPGPVVFCSVGTSAAPVHIGGPVPSPPLPPSRPPTPPSPSPERANLQVQNLAAGSSPVQVCGTVVTGNLQYQNNAASAAFGAASGCPGNTVRGDMTVQSNTGTLTIGAGTAISVGPPTTGNRASGNILVQNNSGSGTSTMAGNWAGGNCTLGGDHPKISVPSAASNYALGKNNCKVSG